MHAVEAEEYQQTTSTMARAVESNSTREKPEVGMGTREIDRSAGGLFDQPLPRDSWDGGRADLTQFRPHSLAR